MQCSGYYNVLLEHYQLHPERHILPGKHVI